MTPTWDILIATLGQRGDRFARLMTALTPQLTAADGAVHVTALWNNGERPLAHVRQDLVEAATGEYVSFIDDDDEVSPRFVATILPLLDGIDYVGWRMQCIHNGRRLKPTFHSLRYSRWYEDHAGYYRDLSHLNPVRREHALRVDYRTVGVPEDVTWVDRVRSLNVVRTEHYVDEVMYTYHASDADSTWRGLGNQPKVRVPTQRHRNRRQVWVQPHYDRPEIGSPHFAYHPGSSV